MSLTHYRTLGRSGLVISPLALGTMTFGAARWGSGEDASREVFNAYVDLGGNLVDTADVYSGGRSEEMVGTFIKDRRLRNDVAISTKAGFSTGKGLLTGGNGARHIHASIEASLRRLQTDYVDMYWIHVWDSVTPAEELLETITTLVRSGKIRYWGMSNTPAWYVASISALARARGQPAPIGMQYFYSLANRDIEDEHVPVAKEYGIGMVPWSPLAYGLLAGKYDRAAVEASAPRAGGLPRNAAADGDTRPEGDKRLDGSNPFGDRLFTERNWAIVDVLRKLAVETGQTPAKIALAWVVGRPAISTTLLGVSNVKQLTDNVSALDVALSSEHLATLEKVSQGDQRMLYSLFTPALREHAVFGNSVLS